MSVHFGGPPAGKPQWQLFHVVGGPEHGRPYFSDGVTVQWSDPALPPYEAPRSVRAPSVESGQENRGQKRIRKEPRDKNLGPLIFPDILPIALRWTPEEIAELRRAVAEVPKTYVTNRISWKSIRKAIREGQYPDLRGRLSSNPLDDDTSKVLEKKWAQLHQI